MELNNVNDRVDKLKRQDGTENGFMVLQLNCNGLLNKLSEIKLYVYIIKAEIICLCETFIKKNEPKFIGYKSFWQHREGHKGGLAILVRRDLTARIKQLDMYQNSQLELQCLEIYSGSQWIHVLNVYNPHKNISHSELTHYTSQLSSHIIIIGDFNAHSPVWDTRGRSNTTGKSIEDLLTNSNFNLLNTPDLPTYLDHLHHSASCLDLCIVSRSLFNVGRMAIGRDVGSDHFPIECHFDFGISKDCEEVKRNWRYSKADWKSFQNKLSTLCVDSPLDVDSHNSNLQESIVEAAEQSIGRTSGKRPIRRHTSGWDEECCASVKKRRVCRSRLWKNPTVANLIEWKRARAKCRYILKQKKTESFASFVESINCNTPSKVIWNKIKSINGNQKMTSLTPIGEIGVDDFTKANLYLDHFTRFKKSSDADEMLEIFDYINSLHFYSFPDITLEGVTSKIHKLKNSSPGDDEISNQIIKKLPQNIMESIVTLFNNSFATSYIPASWKSGVTCPILKPGRDPTNIKSCRPITMLSCVGKLMERVAQSRLEYFLERENKLAEHQMGFRRGCGTSESLAAIFSEVSLSLEKREYSIVVYLDLESAFDTVCHAGLLYKMKMIETPNYLLKWFANYFVNRQIKVRIGTTYSDCKSLEVGCPQGAVLSPTFFNIMLSDLPLREDVKIVTYADDITIVSSSNLITTARNNMQQYLNELVVWLKKWKLQVNPQKSTFQVFSSRRLIPNITLRIYSHNIRLVSEQRVLGVIFDAPKLNFCSHFKSINIECRKRLHIMKVLSSTSWGCSRTLLRRVYVAYIRSKLEYGAVLFTRVRSNNIRKLDLVQNEAMRSILGCRKHHQFCQCRWNPCFLH